MLTYKNYVASIKFDDEAEIFYGEVINTRDVITFQGKSVDQLEKSFQESISDYLNWCKEDGVNPEKPYSGKFNLRIPPELHKQIALAAHKMKLSLNKFVEKALKDEITNL